MGRHRPSGMERSFHGCHQGSDATRRHKVTNKLPAGTGIRRRLLQFTVQTSQSQRSTHRRKNVRDTYAPLYLFTRVSACVRIYCMCLCVRVCVCACIRACACMQACVQACVFACAYLLACVRAYVLSCMQVCVRDSCVRACVRARVYVHAFVRACVYACVCACARECTRTRSYSHASANRLNEQ